MGFNSAFKGLINYTSDDIRN